MSQQKIIAKTGMNSGSVDNWSALLLDDRYFPYFLDFALSANDVGLSDTILFLLGADRLRFPTEGSGCMETMDVAEQYIKNHAALRGLTPLRCLQQLSALSACRVPLVATLAVPCDLIWKEYERCLGQVYSDSAAAAPLKKKIINNAEMSLLSIVASVELRPYFEKFIGGNKELIACYNSWSMAVANIENIRYLRCEVSAVAETPMEKADLSIEILAPPPVKQRFLSMFQRSPLPEPSSSPPVNTASESPVKPTGSTVGATARSRRSSMDTATHRWTPSSTASTGFANNTDYYASVATCPEYDFTGPYEAFAFLLSAVRGIQSQLMDPSIFGGVQLSSSENKPILTDATRLELQTVLTMTSSVRSAHTVESVEIEYARICVLRLARLLHTIEIETFHCLSAPFNSFLHSDHFLDLMGYIRCTESRKTVSYQNKLNFLRQVKSLGELHWRDSDDGAYYLKYKHGVVGDANSPRAQPVHAAGLEASATILAESSRQAIILCRVYGTKDSISHAWKLKVHTEACSGTRAERSIELSPLVSPIGDENAMRQFEGHMEIVKLILGSDRSNSEDEELVTLRFSIDSDQNLLESFWTLISSGLNVETAGSCPSTASTCRVRLSNVGLSALHAPIVSFMCADGEFTSSEMYAICKSFSVTESFVGSAKIGGVVSIHLHRRNSAEDTADVNDSNLQLMCSDSVNSGGVRYISINRSHIYGIFPQKIVKPKQKALSVLDYYRIARPRAEWIPPADRGAGFEDICGASWRSHSSSSRSVSLLAVMRLIGGPTNMASLIMMLLSGSSLVLLSSSQTSVAAFRWAVQNLLYPFPFVHVFRDLTTHNSEKTQEVIQFAAQVLGQMSATVNFDKNRRRQSTEDIQKSSDRDGTLVHPTPVLAYASHAIFQTAFALMHKKLNVKARLSKCFVFDLDSNQFTRHGDETDDELKLLAFCCPSLSNSIQSRSNLCVHCTHEATKNLICNIEQLQTEWSKTENRDAALNDYTDVAGDSAHSVPQSPVVMLSKAGPGCRRRLRRASVILQDKMKRHHFDSFGSDVSRHTSFDEGSGEPRFCATDTLSNITEHPCTIKKKEVVARDKLLVHKNEMVMRCFQIFVSEVFLRYLPEYVSHFPSVDIISCNIQKLLETTFSKCEICIHNRSNEKNCGASATDARLDISQDRSLNSTQNSSHGDSPDRKIKSAISENVGVASTSVDNETLMSAPHVLFLAAVADSLAFTLLLEDHGLALSACENDAEQ